MAGGLIGTPLLPRTSLTGHAVIDHYLGSEISSSDNSAVADTRERRGAVSRLIYQIILYFAKLVTLI